MIRNNKKVFIIAEAGVNHNGNIKTAKKMIKIASTCGADAIKFQTFTADNLTTKKARKAKYQIANDSNKTNQYEMLKNLELSKKMHMELLKECKIKRIMFLSSAFDIDSLNLLNKLKIPIFKIPSGEINNLIYLKKVGSFKKKIILSTGMSTFKEIKDAINILIKAGTLKKNIALLHCNTEYPSPYRDLNLRAIKFLMKKTNLTIGYSDHSLGLEVPIAAVALGAKVIEKHFTLSKNLKGPDHKASLEPVELKKMVQCIRNIEKSLGHKKKIVSRSERKNLKIARKSIYASKNIKEGEKFSLSNLSILRPNQGISPMKIYKVIGKKAKKNYKKQELIKL